MLKRITTALFNHRFVAKYISDRFWVIASYFLMFCILVTIPNVVSISKATLFDGNEAIVVKDAMASSSSSATIKNYKLSTNEAFFLETDAYIYSFNDESFSTDKIVFLFNKTEVSIIEYGMKINSCTYEELGIESLNISSNSTGVECLRIVQMVEHTASGHIGMIKAVVIGFDFISSLFSYLFFMVLFYIIGGAINPNVRGVFRFKIIAYSMTALFVCDFATVVIGNILFHYIGIIYSTIVLFRALRAIVKIEVKKR